MTSTEDLNRGQELLYASLSQAGHGPDRELILSTLQHLMDSCYEAGAESVNLPLLLRCSIRVLRMAGRDDHGQLKDVDEAELASDTCSLFETGKLCAKLENLAPLQLLKKDTPTTLSRKTRRSRCGKRHRQQAVLHARARLVPQELI